MNTDNQKDMEEEVRPVGAVGKIVRFLWFPVLLLCYDVFFAGAPMMAFLTIPVVLLFHVPRSLLGLRKTGLFWVRLQRTGLYVAVIVCSIGVSSVNTRVAEERSERVISALNAYHEVYGQYPGRLEDLVPDFLPAVPKAKLTGMWSEFQYLANPESHLLLYTALPPFGRKVYTMETGTWSQLD